ncbi:hypothetical protein ACX8XP_13965 [Calditrichota bacterium LG25]
MKQTLIKKAVENPSRLQKRLNSQGSQAATKINRNGRKVIFSQITQIIAEKD